MCITHDKGWFNDDDPGVSALGWTWSCNLGTGVFNNDLTISDTPDDIWSGAFTGSSAALVAPRESGAGKIEIRIDGQTRTVADLNIAGERRAQQTVREITGLASGQHSIRLVTRGPGPVAVDALIVGPATRKQPFKIQCSHETSFPRFLRHTPRRLTRHSSAALGAECARAPGRGARG